MIQEILNYQEVEGKLRKIENEIMQSDERKKTAAAKKILDVYDENVAALDKRAENLSAVYSKLTESYAKLNETLKEYSGAFETVDGYDEVSYLTKKTAKLFDSIKALEKEILSFADEIKNVINGNGKLKKTTAEALKIYNENGAKYKELKQSRQAEIDGLKKELLKLSKKVPAEIFDKYNKLTEDKIFPVLYPLTNNRCGRCGMELSMVHSSRIKANKYLECEQCRRIIYIE